MDSLGCSSAAGVLVYDFLGAFSRKFSQVFSEHHFLEFSAWKFEKLFRYNFAYNKYSDRLSLFFTKILLRFVFTISEVINCNEENQDIFQKEPFSLWCRILTFFEKFRRFHKNASNPIGKGLDRAVEIFSIL